MNQQIKLLAKHADVWADDYCSHVAQSYSNWNVTRDEKFAHMIVQECLGICKSVEQIDGMAWECSDAIKEHFGLEF